jgi:hypothetical protein
LCEGLFDSPDTDICKACQRKMNNMGVRVDRSAFGGILQEISLDTRGPDNGDLESYLNNRGDDIRQVLRDSVDLNK